MKRISLTGGKYAIVDDDDYPYLSRFKWSIHTAKNGEYVARKLNRDSILYMSSLIIGCGRTKTIVYKNKDTLDLRKNNLYLADASVKSQGGRKFKNKSSQYKGVSWEKRHGMWKVEISKNRKSYYLGEYKDEKKAAQAYNVKALELYGDIAYQNLIL